MNEKETRRQILARAAGHHDQAVVSAREGEHEAAEHAARKAVELAPGKAKYHLHLGGILLSSGRFEAAEAAFRAAAELNPRGAMARGKVAQCLMRQGRTGEAVALLDSCIELAPNNIRFRQMHAAALAEMGKTRAAVMAAREVIERAPESVDARLLAVRMHLADLQPGRAQHELDAAMTLDPNRRQIRGMKQLQLRIGRMTRQADRKPLHWLHRRFNRRIANVKGEQEEE
jgi:Flp pilus assembly protein TadD